MQVVHQAYADVFAKCAREVRLADVKLCREFREGEAVPEVLFKVADDVVDRGVLLRERGGRSDFGNAGEPDHEVEHMHHQRRLPSRGFLLALADDRFENGCELNLQAGGGMEDGGNGEARARDRLKEELEASGKVVKKFPLLPEQFAVDEAIDELEVAGVLILMPHAGADHD